MSGKSMKFVELNKKDSVPTSDDEPYLLLCSFKILLPFKGEFFASGVPLYSCCGSYGLGIIIIIISVHWNLLCYYLVLGMV